jgi:hypothetical protein
MSKKANSKISINALESIAKEHFSETISTEWCGTELVIKPVLSLKDMLLFCNDITSSCFLEDGSFIPEAMDFAIRRGVLTYYANFSLPDNLEKCYWLIYRTDAYDVVIEYIHASQLDEIINAANRKLKYFCDSDIQTFRAKITELIDVLGNTQSRAADMFGGMSPEDISALLKAIGSAGVLDEEKIVDAYLNRVERDAEQKVVDVSA